MSRLVPIAVVLGLFTIPACGPGEQDLRSTRRDAPTREFDVIPPDVDSAWPLDVDPFAKLRLLHLGVFPAEAESEVSIFLNGEDSEIAFSFLEGTDYVELPPGTYKVDIVPAGGTIDDSAFTIDALELADRDVFSAAAVGYVEPGEGDGELQVLLATDNAAAISPALMRLRVTHAAAASSLANVDIWRVDQACLPTGDEPLVSDLAFTDSTVLQDMALGAFNFGLDASGDGQVDACFQMPSLLGGALYNIYAVNDADGVPSVVIHRPDGAVTELPLYEPAAFVRLLHLGVFEDEFDSEVSIFLNGEDTGVSFAFKEGTDYFELLPGTHMVDVVPVGGELSDSLFTIDEIEVVDGDWISAAAIGYVDPVDDDAPLQAHFADDNDSGIDEEEIRLRLTHAVASASFAAVDVWLVDEFCTPLSDDPLLDSFAFAESAVLSDLPVGVVGFGVDATGDGEVDACFQVPELDGGALYNLYAVNDASGAVSVIAHLPDGGVAEFFPVAVAESARVRVAHLGVFPDSVSSAVDVWINGELFEPLEGVEYLGSSDYFELRPGEVELAITLAGLELEDAVLSTSLSLDPGTSWSVYAAGFVEPDGDDSPVELFVLHDDAESIEEGRVGLNAIHAAGSADFSPVSLFTTDESCAAPGDAIASDVSFGESTGTLSIDVPLTFGFWLGDEGPAAVCYTVPDSLEVGELYNAYGVSSADGTFYLHVHMPDGELVTLEAGGT